jgi:iron complex outermembrane recepter protein
MSKIASTQRSASLLFLAALLSLSPLVNAQQEQAPAASLQEVVVSGTHLATPESESPTPITSITATQLTLAAPSNIPDALNQLPQFMDSNSPSKFTNNGNNSVAGNFLNLRGVGAMRSLVLLDGQRVTPTTASDSTQLWVGSVDVDSLPQLLIKRVDVVTAGASAAYGSDALSGVVNFILDKDFNGFKSVVQGGISGRGDDGSYRVGAAWGAPFAGGRGHLEMSAERYQSNGIPNRADRPAGQPVYLAAGAGTPSDPITTVTGARFSIFAPGGLAFGGPFNGEQFLAGGVPAPFNGGVPLTSTGPYQIGGDGTYWNQQSLVEALDTSQAFLRVSYDVTDSLNAYLQASFSQAGNSYNNLSNFILPGDMTIFSGNAYLSAAAQQELTSTGTQSFLLARLFPNLGPMHIESDNITPTVTLGLNGALSGSWSYDAHYTYGESRFGSDGYNFMDSQRLYAAVDAVVGPNGNTVCRVTLTNPGSYPGCVPFDPFGANSSSAAADAYVTGTSIYHIINRMNDLAFNLHGSPATLWAGPVSLATGAEFRSQSLDQTSNSDPSVPIDFTGLRGVDNTTAFFIGNIGTAHGSESTKEAYMEGEIPLLKDAPLAKSLDLNGAVRYADYSITGSAVTWKTGLVYQPTTNLRVRATRSRDFRAPSLYDLFSDGTSNPAPLDDPHTGVSGIIPRIFGGNPQLRPEIGDTVTGGLTYSFDSLQGLSASVDYYRLKISDLITVLTDQQVVDLCNEAGGTGEYCALIKRPLPYSNTSAANFPTSVSTPDINAAYTRVDGVDIDVDDSHSLGKGLLATRLTLSYTADFLTQQYPGGPIVQSAGLMTHELDDTLSHPRWQGALSFTYSESRLTTFVEEQMIGSAVRGNASLGEGYPTQDGQGGGGQVYADNHVPSVFYTNLTVQYALPWNTVTADVFVNVNNLFDKQPPIIPRSSLPQIDYPTIQYVYDVVGRYFTTGIKVQF